MKVAVGYLEGLFAFCAPLGMDTPEWQRLNCLRGQATKVPEIINTCTFCLSTGARNRQRHDAHRPPGDGPGSSETDIQIWDHANSCLTEPRARTTCLSRPSLSLSLSLCHLTAQPIHPSGPLGLNRRSSCLHGLNRPSDLHQPSVSFVPPPVRFSLPTQQDDILAAIPCCS